MSEGYSNVSIPDSWNQAMLVQIKVSIRMFAIGAFHQKYEISTQTPTWLKDAEAFINKVHD